MPVLAIPHNPNLSGGLTFATTDMQGAEFDPAYVEARRRNEPLTEIFQTKGQSETHPSLSPNDEMADFVECAGEDWREKRRGQKFFPASGR